MTAALVILATVCAGLTVLTGWLARRHVLSVEARAPTDARHERDMRELATLRDAAIVQWKQSSTDLAAVRKAYEGAVSRLAAAEKVIHDDLRAKLVGASDADLARLAGELLANQAARVSAREATAAGAGDGPPAPAGVPESGPAAESGPSPAWAD